MDHFHQVQIHKFEINISGTDFGSLHNIFRQGLKPLWLLIQYIQIPLNSRIIKMFLFQKAYIVNNWCKRCLDIMRNVGNQIRLQSFVFQTLLHRILDSFSDVIDHFCHIFIITGEIIQRNLIFRISWCNLHKPFFDPCTFNGKFCKTEHGCNIYDHCKKDEKSTSCQHHKVYKEKNNWCYDKFSNTGSVLPDIFYHSANPFCNAVPPKSFGFQYPYQAQIYRQHTRTCHSRRNSEYCNCFRGKLSVFHDLIPVNHITIDKIYRKCNT